MADLHLRESSTHPAKCGGCEYVCGECLTAWERDSYREALEAALAALEAHGVVCSSVGPVFTTLERTADPYWNAVRDARAALEGKK